MYIVENVRDRIRRLLVEAVEKAVAAGELPPLEIPAFTVEVPREKEHGDFATNLALLLAKPARTAPRNLAGVLAGHLERDGELVQKVEIAGPGFINFYLNPTWPLAGIPAVLQMDRDYGRVELGQGRKVQVEFVSANPTGLLHMGNARGAALGDSLASILAFAGYDVTREYYINDAGKQVENFALSLEARYFQLLGREAAVPEDGYHGEDVVETVRGFIDARGDAYLDSTPEERRQVLVQYALDEKLSAIRQTLADFGVEYDVWYSEQSLHDGGKVEETVRRLKERGYTYEYEGALWFKGSQFGLEKDEVLIRKSGVPTYFAADVAYHRDKFERGFEWVINIWGADHHGHVPRIKGAMAALGYDPEALTVIIMQLVRLYREGQIVRMSKRTGRVVTLEELMEEVGRDAARYFFVMRSADSHLDFDLDLAKSTSNENPVYYIQYAHARICSILRQPAAEDILSRRAGEQLAGKLGNEEELALAKRVVDFPEEISLAAAQLAPHRLARYLHEVAGLLHSFYNAHRVISGDEELSAARLALVRATRIVLRNGLHLLGLSAPEKM